MSADKLIANYLRIAGCDSRRLVALRCRGRSWCPSCTTRRALETGLHCEAVLPRVAHRQWTLSLPMALRFHFVKQRKLLRRVEKRLVQAVWRLQRAQAKRLGVTGALRGGATCFKQYFGSNNPARCSTPHRWPQEGARRVGETRGDGAGSPEGRRNSSEEEETWKVRTL